VWEELSAAPTPEERARLEADEAAFRRDVALLLGEDGSDALPAALDERLTAIARQVDQTVDSSRALRDLLTKAGVEVGDQDPLVAASAWLMPAGTADVAPNDADDGERAAWDTRRATLDALIAGLQAEERALDSALEEHRAVDSSGSSIDMAAVRGRVQREAAVTAAEDELADALAELEDASLAQKESAQSPARIDVLDETRRRERACQRRLMQAEATAEVAAAHVATAEQEQLSVQVAERSTAKLDTQSDPAEGIAIYLLARGAAVRSIGELGSLPLVLVDPFTDVEAADLVRVLETIARMSVAVQVIYLSDQPEIVGWAEALGPEWAGLRRFGLRGTGSRV
jgi:hypothetical protein